MTLPTIMTQAGLQPQTATDLRAQLVANVAATNPGYTANLPGSLIEDIASTDVAAIALCDAARVELVNSLSPYGANEFLLNQLGQIYGVQLGAVTNTSVYVTFTGVPGFVVSKGFTVSDGSHQYVVQDGGVIESGGTVSLYCVADSSGSWAVPANTVNQLITSAPAIIGLSVTNPVAGTPGANAESWESYRSRVLRAGLAASQGMASYLRTLLGNVAGVQDRLIGIRQRSGSWEVIVGGGDPYAIGYAIFSALFDISSLVGSTTTPRNVTVTINDYPDKYNVIFVNPVAQAVSMTVTWNTTATNFVADANIIKLGSQALSDYVNSLPVGLPMNLFEMQTAFQESVASVIPPQYLSRMVFAVYINSVLTPPTSGTGLYEGDPEGYFTTAVTSISVVRG